MLVMAFSVPTGPPCSASRGHGAWDAIVPARCSSALLLSRRRGRASPGTASLL